jgi:hypothetical protein
VLFLVGRTTMPPDHSSDHPSRRPAERHSHRHLEARIWIFSIAAGIALVGIYFDERWMTGVALTLLLGAVMLRFLPGDDVDRDEASPPDP